ncbi:pumilio homolog 18 [Brassica rapa]|uniref:pumilio homolog 18 n=1 Tax=Brassica campestris TaxID=3711 RepID=UPI00142E6147|nr:pumilio homolog 18 [Brassica rapa]
MANNNPFSMSTMLKSLQDLRSATEKDPAVPPPPHGVTPAPPPPYGLTAAPPPGYGVTPAPPPPYGVALAPPPGYGVALAPPPGYGVAPAPPPPYGVAPAPPPPYGVTLPPPPPYGVALSPPPPYGVAPAPPPPYGVAHAPPPGYAPPFQPCACGLCDESPLQWMFNLMTRSEEEDAAYPFKVFISNLDRRELLGVASLLTSDPDYFLEIARNKNGSNRLQKLVGKSDDVDNLICDAILYRFLHVMTDKHASYVATRGLRVFAGKKKEFMCEELIHHALLLARDRHGCVALNAMLTDLDHPYYRNQLLDIVAHNALPLSNDTSGNFVVQHVLKLNNPRTMGNVALSLRGHCIDLSFKKYGSYIVERLLEADESVAVVVMELVESNGDRLMRLTRSEYGNYVVNKALKVTQRRKTRVDLFRGLVQKLMPFLTFLRKSRGNNIAVFLESVHQTEVA